MKIIFSDRHRLHRGDKEMYRGELVPCFEKPERADYVYDAVKSRKGAGDDDLEIVGRHDQRCIARTPNVDTTAAKLRSAKGSASASNSMGRRA